MGILKRVADMTKASLNEVLDKMEDPVVMLNQYVRDMEMEINEAERTVARQMTAEARLKQRREAAVQTAEACQAKAEQALAAGDEDQARRLLEQKLASDEQVAQFAELLAQQEGRAAELSLELESMREELARLRARRGELASRAEAARAKKQVAQVYAPHAIESGGAVRGFSRMEEKIMQLEAEVEVSGTYRASAASYVSASPSTVKQAQVEDALDALKRKTSSADAAPASDAASDEAGAARSKENDA
ncbi:PspA/IM30 family protein [Paenibacillus sp. IB182496]|uniref:PspA/IM30 family protein n=1 Tax=Paenibacillus sabuli TaxID=2772509 RepID=A0A927BX92_9BACL|nr:PspA/IM30 family protein [Paenibacillus sabuli]MBD2847174.1 PspA/IM30 family protein [Paenibacillus sabuli]